MPATPPTSGCALFDLDQTLIPWDTQLLFANHVLQHEPWRRLYLLIYLPFLPFAKLVGTENLKRIFLSYLWGMSRERIDELAQSFVADVIPSACYAEMLDRLAAERGLGRRTILLTASPDIYGIAIGRALGFREIIATPVSYGQSMPLFPDLPGGNNKGATKIDRLRELAPELFASGVPLPDSIGYSDSHADLPMLEICETAVVVHPTDRLSTAAEGRDWQLAQPTRPTSSKWQFAKACLKQALGLYQAR